MWPPAVTAPERVNNPIGPARKILGGCDKSSGMATDEETEETETETETEAPPKTHKFCSVIVQAKTYGDPQKIAVPEGAELLEAIFYEGRITVWFKAKLDAAEEDRHYKVIADDVGFDDATCTHVGMVLRPDGNAYHVVEVTK